MSKSQGRKQRLYNQINVCEKVRRTINSKGWREILGPLLEKRIKDVTGQRDENGIYVMGMLDRDPKKETYYIGYKTALMDFNNDVYNHLVAITATKASLKELEDKAEKEATYTKPMEDTKYAQEA